MPDHDWQPMRSQRCENCRFWNALDDFTVPGHPDNEAECLRYPPELNLAVIQQKVKENEDEEFYDADIPIEEAHNMYAWLNPITAAEHSCGEWMPIGVEEEKFREKYKQHLAG